jgi:cysteine-rich repeat protein
MNRFRMGTLMVAMLTLGAVGFPNASAALLSADDQSCIRGFTADVARVRKVQGNVVHACLKRFASGSLIGSTPEGCVRASLTEENTKLTAASLKTSAPVGCAAAQPAFGVSDSTAANIMAAGTDVELVRRIIGPNLDAALIPTTTDARCQVRVAAALQKCAAIRISQYQKCLRRGMSAGTIVDAATLQTVCLGGGGPQPDPAGRIAKLCETRVAKAIARYCENVDLRRAFAPCKSSDPQDLTACVNRESACKLCQVLNAVNGLSEDCDAFDDGNADDGTCGDECADGVVQSGEGCDDGNTTDGDGCSSDCKVEVGWGCTGEPSVCTPACGNGVVDSAEGEECDDGNTVSGDGCSSSCKVESCANGRLDAGETCDDGNHTDGDGCSNACQTEPGYLCSGQPSVCAFVCGNGTFEAGETCDDGNTIDGDGCNRVCKIEKGFTCSGRPSVCTAVCGDGLVRTGEGCDDANVVNGDGCANSCQPETGYHCTGEPSVCAGICGDGYTRAGESCDDGNMTDGDGCSAGCQQEPGWSCTGQPSVCAPNCGNGRLDAGEQCDDGNGVSGDGCSQCAIDPGYACAGQPSLCSPSCGNGQVQPTLGEQCDDHNTTNGDGCSAGCLIEPGYTCSIGPGGVSVCTLHCGNGQIETSLGEQCDDGNRVWGDGCSADCQVEFAYDCAGEPSHCYLTCGDGQVEAGELCDDGNTVSGDGCDASCLTEPGWYCSGTPSTCQKFGVVIDSPAHGTFTEAGTVDITGHYTVLPAGQVSVTINGVAPNLSFNPETRQFAHRMSLDQAAIFNPILATVSNTATGDEVHARSVVIAAASVADGAFSPESVALRLNESGLAAVEPMVASQAGTGLDIGKLMPANTTLVDQCFIDMGFLGCWGRAKVSIANPPPSFSGLSLKTDARPGVVHGDISVNSLRVDIAINGSGLVPSCGMRISANQMVLGGDFALEPAAQDPSHVDVNLVSPMSVSLPGFSRRFTWGICTWPIIGDIINAVLPNVQNMASSGIQGFLNDPDGAGPRKSPVAEGIESALDGVNLSGAVGQGVGLSFDAPLFEIAEDNVGVTLGADSRFTVSIGSGPGQCTPPPGTPNLTASYSRYEPFPSFGATTPERGVPYGLGIAISTAGFNQLLRGQTECGLMRSSLTEIDMDGQGGAPPTPITSDLLSLFVPEFAALPPGTPLRIDLAPTLAPIVTGNRGPNGEVAELRIEQLAISIVEPSTGTVWLRGAFDARLGMELAFLPDGSGLAITINKPATSDVTVTVIDNPLGANEEAVQTVLPTIMAPMIPSLASALSGFPLPQFFGLHLQGVEVSRNGQFLSLFANLVAGP